MQGITFAAFLLAAAMPVIVKVFLRAGNSKSLISSLPSSIHRCIRFVQLLAGGEQQQRGGIYPSSPLLGCSGGDGEAPQRVQQRGRPVRAVSYSNDEYARTLNADHDISPPTSLDDLLLRNIRGSSRPASRSGSRPPSRSNSRPPSRSNSRPPSRNGSRPPSLGSMSPLYATSTLPAKPTRRPFLRKSSYDSTHSTYSVSSPSAVTSSTSAVFESFAIGLGGACDYAPPSASDYSPRGRGRTQSWNVTMDAFSNSNSSSTSPNSLTILEVRDGIVCQREVEGETGSEGDMGAGGGAGLGETADLVDLAAAWASSRGVDTNVGLEHFEARSMLGRAIRKFKAKSRRLKQMGAREQVVREARENWARRSLEFDGDEWAATVAAAAAAAADAAVVTTNTISPRSSISSETAPPTTVYHASVPDAADPTVLEAVVEVPHLEKTPILRPAESMDSLARDIAAISAESELPHSPVESLAASTVRPVSRGKAAGKSAAVGRRLSISIRAFKKRSSSAPENRKRAGSGGSDLTTISRRRTMMSWGRAK